MNLNLMKVLHALTKELAQTIAIVVLLNEIAFDR